MNIRTVNNGFIIEVNGVEYIAKTLMEAAAFAGEIPHGGPRTEYAKGRDADSLEYTMHLIEYVGRIQAIKHLRSCYTPTLGLREAKELVDLLITTKTRA